jgi:hypothetical protein
MAGDLEQAPRYPNLRAHPFNYPSRPSRSPLSVGELSSLGALNHPRKRQESQKISSSLRLAISLRKSSRYSSTSVSESDRLAPIDVKRLPNPCPVGEAQ